MASEIRYASYSSAAKAPEGYDCADVRGTTLVARRAHFEAVRTALSAGASWADIGRVTGLTGRSATERWSARD